MAPHEPVAGFREVGKDRPAPARRRRPGRSP